MWNYKWTVTGARWPAWEVWSCHSKLLCHLKQVTHPLWAQGEWDLPPKGTVGIENRNECLGRDTVSYMVGDIHYMIVIIIIIIITVLLHFYIFRDMELTTKFSLIVPSLTPRAGISFR